MSKKPALPARDQEPHYDVIVIGGGASGMMAACTAGEQGKQVLLLEKNKRLGEKLRISGGGRCNITNAEEDVRILLKKYGGAEQALYSAFARFGVKETFAFFESRGLPLVIEANKRAFPKTQKAIDVLRVLEDALKVNGVRVKTGAPVSSIKTTDGMVSHVVAGGVVYTAKTYILATGGVSHPETGSTGDGFPWLTQLGHTVSAPSPTIVPLSTKESWSHALLGSSCEAKVTFFVHERKAFVVKGNVLFTHFGLSGPTILNASSRVADLLQEGSVTARIDCAPHLDDAGLEAHILKIFDAGKNKMLKNVFKLIVPGIQASFLTHLRTIDPDKKVHSITKEERKLLCRELKAVSLTITGLMGFDRAVVADGGVALSEIDMKRMRSLRVSNLFVTGDLLNIRRPSGGYSLQLCWTTGFIAGMNA
jgi:predicted Rossmann fold flavoprotein